MLDLYVCQKGKGECHNTLFKTLFFVFFPKTIILNYFFKTFFSFLFFLLKKLYSSYCSCAGYCDQIAVVRTHTILGENHNIFKPELQIKLCRTARGLEEQTLLFNSPGMVVSRSLVLELSNVAFRFQNENSKKQSRSKL